MTKILVIGDLMIDRFLYCDVDRISPEAPVPVASLVREELVLGGAANVARNVSFLAPEVQVSLIGRIELSYKSLLTNAGIQTIHTVWSKQTNVKTRIIHLSTGYHMIRLDNENKIDLVERTLDIEKTLSAIEQEKPTAVIISDYAKGAIQPELASVIIDYGICSGTYLTYVDSRRTDFSCFKYCELIGPNAKEFENLCSSMNLSKDPEAIIKNLGLSMLLLTKSHLGMDLYISGKNFHVDPSNRTIIDVTGAGDTVLASFVLAKTLYPDVSPFSWLKVANKLAGQVCMKRGTAIPDVDIKQAMRDSDGNQEI